MGDPRNVSRGAPDRTSAAGASCASGTSGLTPGGEPTGRNRSRHRGRTPTIALVCLLAVVLLGSVLLLRQCGAPHHARTWVLAACDVGQGDALFLALGPGEAIAVDTGPDPAKEDACASELGIKKVPLLILTHFHADHIDGLPGLLKGRSIGEIETTTLDDPPAGAAQVRRIAAAAGIPVTPVTPDEQRTFGRVSWRVLWPQAEHPLTPPMTSAARTGGGMAMSDGVRDGAMAALGGGIGVVAMSDGVRDGAMAALGGGIGVVAMRDVVRGGVMAMSGGGGSGTSMSGGGGGGGGGMAEDGPGENSAPNDSSIVMAVTVRTGPDVSADATASTEPGTDSASGTDPGSAVLRILLTGDIEAPVQRILAADRPRYLPADILKVPHHGSANQDPAFLAAVHPSVSVISVGAGNRYGHPSPRTVYLAGTDGARVLRTDLDGMVLIDAPDGPDAPIPVTATRGEGTVPTAGPSPGPSGPSGAAHRGGRRSHRYRGGQEGGHDRFSQPALRSGS